MSGIKQRLIILLVCIALCVGTCNAAAVVETVDTFELPPELLSKRVIEENPIDITGELMPIYGSASTAEFDRGKVKFGTETLWISTKSDITVQNPGLFGTKLFASENWVDIESESVTNIDKNEISWITSDVYIKYHYNDAKLKEEIILEKPSKIVVNYEISDGSHIIKQPDRTLKLTNFRENILIERPFAIDGNGKKFVLDWEINRETQQFMLVGDLSSAKYPIVVDPTLVIVEEPYVDILDFALDSDNNPHILYERHDYDNDSMLLLYSHMNETNDIITTTIDTLSLDDFMFADAKIIIGDDDSVNILYSGVDFVTFNGLIIYANPDDLINKSVIFEQCETMPDRMSVITESSSIYAIITGINLMTYSPEVHYLDFDGDSWSNITITELGLGFDINLHDSRSYICYVAGINESTLEGYLHYSEYNGDDFTNIITIPMVIDGADRADSEIDNSGNIHIIYTDRHGNSTSYAFYDGNMLSYDIVDEYSDNIALSVDSNNNPHVVYETETYGVKYAFLNETGWEYAPLSQPQPYDLGNPIFDRNCRPYVPYRSQPVSNSYLFGYYYYDGDSWSNHLIDDVPRSGSGQRVWTHPIMISDDFGGIHAIYASGYWSESGTVSIRYYYETPPIANFTTNTTETNEHTPIQFTDMSTGNVLVYNWSFGDGNFSVEPNPVYAYPTFGNYTVTLTVENEVWSDTKIGHVLVHNATPVINDFTASVLESEYPVSIHFTPDITGTVHNYYWDFGDGQGSSTSNPDHTYTYPGWFTVELDAANDGGQDAMTKTNYIRILSYYPTCEWATQYGGDRTLRFIDHSSVGEFDEPITEYSWDFGDGATSTEKNPVHFYPSIGQGDPFHNYFEVTHGVKNARGWTYTTATVDVHNDPNWVPVKPESGSMSFLWLPYNDLYLSEFISQNPLDDTVEIDNVGLVATCIMWLQAHTAQMGVLIASLIVVTVLTLKTQSVFALFLSMSLIVSHMTTSWCPEEAKFLLWVILAISLVGIILKPIVGRT